MEVLSEPFGSFNLMIDFNIRLSNLPLLKRILLSLLKNIATKFTTPIPLKHDGILSSEVTTEDNYLSIIL